VNRVGIDLGGTKIEAVALAPDGTELARRRVPTPQGDYDATLAAIADLVHGFEHAVMARCRVGIGMPGTISPATGLVKNANSTWLNGRPFRRDVERALGRPVALANDADCFALSEATDGAGAGARVVFGVILGTGVGGGIVVDGRLLAGPNAIAGEWGHNPLPWPRDEERPGPSCYCSRAGCIETFLSGPGLARDHARAEGLAEGAALPAPEIAALAAAGDEGARRALERHAERLARALAHVINLLDPHAIVLGGGLSALPSLYERVPSLWSRWVFSDRVDTRLLPPAHGDASGVRGAAWLAATARHR
jgi:fructokinase